MSGERSVGRTVIVGTLRAGEEVGFVGGAFYSLNSAISHDWFSVCVSAGISVVSKAAPVAFRRITEARNQRYLRNHINSA